MNLAIFTTAFLAGTFGQPTPATELAAAVADCRSLPVEARPVVRYLSLYNIEPSKRDDVARVASYAVNALSRTRTIVQPAKVSETLYRISIADYTASREEFRSWSTAWEATAELDPYWHLRTEVLASIATQRKLPTQSTSLRSQVPAKASTKIVTVAGGWTGLENATALQAMTGSIGGLLRADFFIFSALSSSRYYEFAGVPATEAEFLKSLGIDSKTIDRLRANAGANLIISNVTFKPRRIVWQQGPLGGVYSTLDIEQVDAARDPLRRPITADGATFKFDASEWFAMAPNGLWRVALYDSAGKQQQTVPDKVAKDTSEPHGDGIVTPLISCIRCHVEGGLRPFADDQSKLLSQAEFRSYKPELVQRVAEFYDEPRLQRQVKFDRESYETAVARATGGMTSKQLAEALADVVRAYAYDPITIKTAASEVGLDALAFVQATERTNDPILHVLRQGRRVLRGQWESTFQEAALTAEAMRKPP